MEFFCIINLGHCLSFRLLWQTWWSWQLIKECSRGLESMSTGNMAAGSRQAGAVSVRSHLDSQAWVSGINWRGYSSDNQGPNQGFKHEPVGPLLIQSTTGSVPQKNLKIIKKTCFTDTKLVCPLRVRNYLKRGEKISMNFCVCVWCRSYFIIQANLEFTSVCSLGW